MELKNKKYTCYRWKWFPKSKGIFSKNENSKNKKLLLGEGTKITF